MRRNPWFPKTVGKYVACYLGSRDEEWSLFIKQRNLMEPPDSAQLIDPPQRHTLCAKTSWPTPDMEAYIDTVAGAKPR